MSEAVKHVMVQGRIVWVMGATPFEGVPRVNKITKQPTIGKDGKQQVEYGFGLAVPMESLQQGKVNQDLWPAIQAAALSVFPNGQFPPNFAWKFKNGDTDIDHRGKPFREREGYAGHIVLSCTTTIPIRFFRWENNANTQVSEGIRCGDYVEVAISIRGHSGVGEAKPGIYINPNMVRFLAYGTEIVSGPSVDTVFGGAPTSQVGGQASPIGQTSSNPLPSMGTAPSFQQTPQTPAPPTVPPNYGVLPPSHQPTQTQTQGFIPPTIGSHGGSGSVGGMPGMPGVR